MDVARRLLLRVQFDGTLFSGFQRQQNARTVQGEIETCWHAMLGETVVSRSSSRTDAGVHARRMPVLVETRSNVPTRGLKLGLNSFLPDDVAVQDAGEVGPEFDVRADSTGKRYVYRIALGECRQPLWLRYAWHVRGPLDTGAMWQAASMLEGVHDFASFRTAQCEAKSTVRHLRAVQVAEAEPGIVVTVDGNAFLHNMVRILVGTLVDVGRARFAPEHVQTLLEAPDRTRAGQTAPSHGLTLDEVFYGPHGSKQGQDYKNLLANMEKSRASVDS
jgi:tRNA pseudouridine38-40 synthase